MYRYGWQGLPALKYMLEESDQEIIYRDYTATMQRHLVNMLTKYLYQNPEWEPPSYIDIAHPSEKSEEEQKQEQKRKDEEDIAHVYEAFGFTKPERG